MIEGLLYAADHGFAPHDVAMYFDGRIFGHAVTHLHPGNFALRHSDGIYDRIDHLCKHLYGAGV